MRVHRTVKLGIIGTLGLLLLASAASAVENEIENPLDTVNKHFEEASKDFGGGVTQLHARKEGADGTEHLIYHFDCSNKQYELFFGGLAAPDGLPDAPGGPLSDPIDANDPVAPLAQHTCTKHGYPLLEW